MNHSLTISAFLLVSALSAAAATEENIHEIRAAKPGGTLVVDIDFGSIDVAPGDNDKVVIDAHRKIEASSKEKEEEYLKQVPIRITTEGDNVILRAIHKHESLGSQLWRMFGHTSTEGRYTIRVPAEFSADLDTSGGNIAATGLRGTIKADTSGGNLTFASIHGEIHADTSGGNIKATDCEAKINLDTSGGRIEVTDGRGTLHADTSGGAITVLNFAGDTKVESSGGKLRLANISGKLHAETSGGAIAAILSSPVVDDVSLETSAGSITVMTPRDAPLTIDAETSAGHVRSELPVTQTHAHTHDEEDSLRGTINGGGKKLTLRSGAGSIEIVSNDKQPAQQ